MWFRTPGGTPGAAWQALCPRAPSGRRSLGLPSGSAAPSASHRQTDGGKRRAPGPPGPAAAAPRRKREETTFHNSASGNWRCREKNTREFLSHCLFSGRYFIPSPFTGFRLSKSQLWLNEWESNTCHLHASLETNGFTGLSAGGRCETHPLLALLNMLV